MRADRGNHAAAAAFHQAERAGLQRRSRARDHDARNSPPALADALKFGAPALVERFIRGRELTVGVLGDQVLPIIEIRPLDGFYDYTNKYTKGRTEYFCPAPLPDDDHRADPASRARRASRRGPHGLFAHRFSAREGQHALVPRDQHHSRHDRDQPAAQGRRRRRLHFPQLCRRIVELSWAARTRRNAAHEAATATAPQPEADQPAPRPPSASATRASRSPSMASWSAGIMAVLIIARRRACISASASPRARCSTTTRATPCSKIEIEPEAISLRAASARRRASSSGQNLWTLNLPADHARPREAALRLQRAGRAPFPGPRRDHHPRARAGGENRRHQHRPRHARDLLPRPRLRGAQAARGRGSAAAARDHRPDQRRAAAGHAARRADAAPRAGNPRRDRPHATSCTPRSASAPST